MSLYRYHAPSALDEIRFMETENGSLRAYLHAREGTPVPKLNMVIEHLHREGMETVPHSDGERHTLEVRGLRKENALIASLRKAKVIEGTPEITREADNQSTLEKWKKRTLQASGISMMVADIGFLTYGLKENHWEDAAAGLSYLSGSAILSTFGRNDQSDLQIRDFAKNIEQFYEQHIHEVPGNCSITDLAQDKDRNVLDRTMEPFRRFPSEIANSMYAVAGTLIARSAYKYHVTGTPKPDMDAKAIREMRSEGRWDMGLGLSTLTSGLLGTFVKEKKRDPDADPAKGLAWAKEWVQEKPLRISGYGYMVSTLCHAISTMRAYKDAKRTGDHERLKSVPYRAAFVGFTLIGEILMAISSKGHGEGVVSDESVKQSIYSLTAELIAAQPKEERESHIHLLSGFLEKPEVLAESRDKVEKQLRERIAEIEKNPWACNDARMSKDDALLITPEAPFDRRKQSEERLIPSTTVASSAQITTSAPPEPWVSV